MTLEEVLVKDPSSWDDDDYRVILAAKKSKGHEYVKRLRDRLNRPKDDAS